MPPSRYLKQRGLRESCFSVGFRNDCGGYELSNPYFKGSVSPKGIISIRKDKDTCLVFEVFWDFLSLLTLKNIRKLQHDVAILNSVANLSKGIDFIASHKKVFAYLNSDEAGKRAVRELQSVCKNVSDQSGFYAKFKDLNDYLCNNKLLSEKQIRKGFKL